MMSRPAFPHLRHFHSWLEDGCRSSEASSTVTEEGRCKREKAKKKKVEMFASSHTARALPLSLLPPFPYKRRKSSQLPSAAYPQFHLHQWVRGHGLTMPGNGELDARFIKVDLLQLGKGRKGEVSRYLP